MIKCIVFFPLARYTWREQDIRWVSAMRIGRFVATLVVAFSTLAFMSRALSNNAGGSSLCPEEIEFGDTLTCAFSADQPAHFFIGDTGEHVFIRAETVADGSGIKVVVGRSDQCQRSTAGPSVTFDCQLTTDRRHSLIVEEPGGGRENRYRLYLQRVPEATHSLAITFDETVHAKLLQPGEFRAFHFQGDAGRLISIRVQRTVGTFTPIFRVYRPDGTLQCQTPPPDAMADKAWYQCALDASGTFSVLVGAADAGSTGEFQVGWSLVR